jgi:hypothetical protein
VGDEWLPDDVSIRRPRQTVMFEANCLVNDGQNVLGGVVRGVETLGAACRMRCVLHLLDFLIVGCYRGVGG